MITNCGIRRVVCERKYHAGAKSERMFQQAGIELEYKNDEVQTYPETLMQPPRHFVAVGALVCNEQGEILLKRHPVRGWEFPGGRVEQGEDLIDALKREVMEETGYTIETGPLGLSTPTRCLPVSSSLSWPKPLEAPRRFPARA